jgi:flagellar basal body-associated protein FliL
MGAFEFYLEGEDSEVIVEVKDREVEIRDRMQRTLEEFTFDQAADADGKKMIVDKLKKEINQSLSTGKIRKIWFKTVVIKP